MKILDLLENVGLSNTQTNFEYDQDILNSVKEEVENALYERTQPLESLTLELGSDLALSNIAMILSDELLREEIEEYLNISQSIKADFEKFFALNLKILNEYNDLDSPRPVNQLIHKIIREDETFGLYLSEFNNAFGYIKDNNTSIISSINKLENPNLPEDISHYFKNLQDLPNIDYIGMVTNHKETQQLIHQRMVQLGGVIYKD